MGEVPLYAASGRRVGIQNSVYRIQRRRIHHKLPALKPLRSLPRPPAHVARHVFAKPYAAGQLPSGALFACFSCRTANKTSRVPSRWPLIAKRADAGSPASIASRIAM